MALSRAVPASSPEPRTASGQGHVPAPLIGVDRLARSAARDDPSTDLRGARVQLDEPRTRALIVHLSVAEWQTQRTPPCATAPLRWLTVTASASRVHGAHRTWPAMRTTRPASASFAFGADHGTAGVDRAGSGRTHRETCAYRDDQDRCAPQCPGHARSSLERRPPPVTRAASAPMRADTTRRRPESQPAGPPSPHP